jgi:hypothetical protein
MRARTNLDQGQRPEAILALKVVVRAYPPLIANVLDWLKGYLAVRVRALTCGFLNMRQAEHPDRPSLQISLHGASLPSV